MPEPLDDRALERLIDDTRELIDSLRAGTVPADATKTDGRPETEGHGEAADGRVRVTARRGLIESIAFDPRLLRLPSEEFGESLRDALNAALGDLLGRSAVPGAVPDPAVLTEVMRQVQNEGLRQMMTISRGIADAMDKIRERTHISGDPTPHGLEQMLSLAQRNLDDALAAGGGGPEDVRAEGSAANGRIAVVVATGRVESVTIEQSAMRMASHELAERVRTAVNDALAKLPAGTDRTAGGDAEELRRRVREVQDMSVARMRSYTRALRDIMASIEGPE